MERLIYEVWPRRENTNVRIHGTREKATSWPSAPAILIATNWLQSHFSPLRTWGVANLTVNPIRNSFCQHAERQYMFRSKIQLITMYGLLLWISSVTKIYWSRLAQCRLIILIQMCMAKPFFPSKAACRKLYCFIYIHFFALTYWTEDKNTPISYTYIFYL